MFSTIIGDSRAPSEGFFGTIGSAWETGVSKIGSEILPNWVQSQVSRQSGDQLSKSTFDASAALPRVEGQPIQDADLQPKTALQKATDFQLFRLGNINVTGGQVLLMGMILIGLVVVLKKV